MDMRGILRTLTAAASICLLASAADAGDQGDPAQSCDGNTYEMHAQHDRGACPREGLGQK
jgi:hypothetical protein